MWNGYKNYDHYFTMGDKIKWMNEIKESRPTVTSGKKTYWNIPASFDIETSSYYQMGEKYATMYLWALCINGSTIVGRTWEDFTSILSLVNQAMHTDDTRLIIYVHNLGYEFQFMRGWLDIEEVFSVKERRPIHVTCKNGIEFKCSYILSNYSLAYLGEKLLSCYKVQKDVGALDYSKVRHSETALQPKELWYNVHDVQVVTSFIQEKLENEGEITTIPLTNTGYVRNYCRNFCFTNGYSDKQAIKKARGEYHDLCKALRITSKCEYDQLKAAFAGGFTHAAPAHSGELLSKVGSKDAASHYPGQMVRKPNFPMSRGTFVGAADLDDLAWLTKHGYVFIFTVRFTNISPEFIWENYISVSHCQELSKDAVVNNGRVASASILQTTITDVDWDIIKRAYTWDSLEIYNLRFYKGGYLPKPFILSILNLYAKKTTLKGVEGKETEYMVSKNMINSAYGMAVTNIIRDLYEYSVADESWLTTKIGEVETKEALSSYNNNYNRFLFYPWGVWVTANARHDLWDAIFEFGPDFVYADTDSIKGLNFKKHEEFFTLHNFKVMAECKKMCEHYKIPFTLCTPKTKKGETKPIGIFEDEGEYQLFKTIGAKRYMFEKDNNLWFTISGVNKYYGMPYLLTEYTDYAYTDSTFEDTVKLAYSPRPQDKEASKEALKYLASLRKDGFIHYEQIFDAFHEGLFFPPSATGKQTLTYCDDPFVGECIDFRGIPHRVMEYSYIHMEPQGYNLSQTEEYKRFLEGFRDASI